MKHSECVGKECSPAPAVIAKQGRGGIQKGDREREGGRLEDKLESGSPCDTVSGEAQIRQKNEHNIKILIELFTWEVI